VGICSVARWLHRGQRIVHSNCIRLVSRWCHFNPITRTLAGGVYQMTWVRNFLTRNETNNWPIIARIRRLHSICSRLGGLRGLPLKAFGLPPGPGRKWPGFFLLTVGDVGGPTNSPSVAGGMGGGRAGVRVHGLLHTFALGVGANTFYSARACSG